MKKIITTLIFCAFYFCSSASTQIQAKQNDSTTPQQSETTYQKGTLDNGLEYLIFRVPEAGDRINVRLQVGVGSIDEKADEYGSAHMLEHMVFQGGEKFPDGAWDHLMHQGWIRGSQYNASTGYEKTTYVLNPPKGKAQLEQLFDMLADMMFQPSLTAEEWEKERQIILQERLMRSGPLSRLRIQRLKSTLHSSRYTQSEIIGRLKDIQNRKVGTLRKFHKRWYHPNNMKLLVVVGDTSIDAVAEKIEKKFAPAPFGKLPEREHDYYEPKLTSGWNITQIKEKNSGSSSVSLLFRSRQKLLEEGDKVDYNELVRESLIEGFAISAVKNRFKQIRHHLPEGVISVYFSKFRAGRYTDVAKISASIQSDAHDKGIKELISLREQILRYPITVKEMEDYQKSVQRVIDKKKENPDFPKKFETMVPMAKNFLFEDSPIITPMESANFLEKHLPTITEEQINQKLSEWLNADDKILQLQTSGLKNIALPSANFLDDLITKTSKSNIKPPISDNNTEITNILPILTKPGTITAEKNYSDTNVTEWKLSNGDTFVYLRSDIAKKDALLSIDVPIGYMAQSLNPWQSKLAAMIVWQSGPKGFNKKSISDWRKENKVSLFSRKVKAQRWMIAGTSEKNNIDGLFKLYQAHLLGAQVGDNFKISRMRSLQSLDSPLYQKNIQKREALARLIYGKIQYKQPNKTDIKNLTPDDLLDQWNILKKVPVTYYLLADVPNEEIKPVIEKYLAGIPRLHNAITFTPFDPVDNAQGDTKTIVPLGSEKRDEFSAITWSKEHASPQSEMTTRLSKQLASKYLQIALRDKEQAVYSVKFSASINPHNARLRSFLFFTCDSEKTNQLWNKARKILENLPQQITETEINQLKTNYQKREIQLLKKPKTWLSRLRRSYIYYGNPSFLLEMKTLEKDITLENIKSASKKLWNSNTTRILQVTPEI